MEKETIKISETRTIIFISVIVGAVLSLLSLIGLIFNQPGWVIGVVLGAICCIANSYILVRSSGLVLSDSKPGFFLFLSFIRIIAFVGIFATLVLLQFVAHIDAIKNAFWGFFIGFSPSTIISVISQLKSTK